jgi:hypothetical protein
MLAMEHDHCYHIADDVSSFSNVRTTTIVDYKRLHFLQYIYGYNGKENTK